MTSTKSASVGSILPSSVASPKSGRAGSKAIKNKNIRMLKKLKIEKN